MPPSGFHHVEIWVADLGLVEPSWKWLLAELGWEPYQNWSQGRSWRIGDAYLVVETGCKRLISAFRMHVLSRRRRWMDHNDR